MRQKAEERKISEIRTTRIKAVMKRECSVKQEEQNLEESE
jgi:hypothetical protein